MEEHDGTISTSAGFTPVASDITYVAKKRDVPKRLSLVQRAVSNQPQQKILKAGSGGLQPSYSPALFPQAVNCVKINEVATTKTITIPLCTKTKKTTLAPSTATILPSVSTTTTSTVYLADATATSTFLTTVTTVTTTTSTETDSVTTTGNPRTVPRLQNRHANRATSLDTQTSAPPSATFYAACASDNIVGSANGNHGITNVRISDASNPNTVVIAGATTPYDCCVACQQSPNCIYSFFYADCELVTASTCSPGNAFDTFYKTDPNVASGGGFILSNGACGRIPNGGDV